MTRALERDEDGVAATEFAIVAPILILLFFGIVYFGLYVYRAQVLESATREAARVASVGGDANAVESALDAAAVGFTAAEANISSSTLCTAGTDTAVVAAEARGARLDFTVPFFGTVDPTFRATATFQCETRS